MDSCILKQCRDDLASQIRTPPRIIESARPSPSCIELTLEWAVPDDRRCLILDVDPGHPTAHLARHGRGSIRHGTGFAERAVGTRLAAIGPDAGDPEAGPHIWRLDLCDSGGALRWRLMAAWTGRSGNIRLTDPSGRILESLMPGGPRPGAVYSPPPSDSRTPAGGALPQLSRAIVGLPPKQLHHAVRRTVRDVELPAALDAVLSAAERCPDLRAIIEDDEAAVRAATEILRWLRLPACIRTGADRHEPAPSDEAAAAALPGACDDGLSLTPEGTTCTEHHLYIFPRDGTAAALDIDPASIPAAWVSSVRLPSLERFRRDEARPLRDLLDRAHQLQCMHADQERERADALLLLRHEAERLRRLHTNLMAERVSPGEGMRLRRSGEAILASLHMIRRGDREVLCPDWSDPDNTKQLRIALDPARPAADNAADYFRRARRWERGEPHRAKRLAAIDRASARLAELETQIAGGRQSLPISRLAREVERALGFLISPRIRGMLQSEGPGPDRARARLTERPGSAGRRRQADAAGRTGKAHPSGPASDRRHRPRSFRTKEGWTVLVGRSNEENDHLTHRIAHPEDYWLHAHGVPGSHVVLRREGRKDNPSARTLEEAAAIAAFFSKARHSRKVPVLYTLKKYVRKPRKAKPGLAVCTREKTLLVAPKDPTEGRTPEWMEEE